MHTSAISAIIAFLTDSLIPFFHPMVLHAVRLHLRVTLPSYFASSTELSLSPRARPPLLMRSTPVPFSQWMASLGNQPIRIVVSQSEVKAVIQNRPATLWRREEELCYEEPLVNEARKSLSGMKLVLARPVPTLPVTVRVVLPMADASSSSSSDSDSESEFDSEDGYTSEESMTSISSIQSLYSVSKPTTTTIQTTGTTGAPLATSAPSNATTYLYQGGRTNVVTGGVMLGAGAGKVAQPATIKAALASVSLKRPAFLRTRSAADSGNWRRRD